MFVRFARLDRSRFLGSFSVRMNSWVGGLDVGTQSSRFVVFDDKGTCLVDYQIGIDSTYPRQGWVEQDPEELYTKAIHVMDKAVSLLVEKKLLQDPSELPEKLKGIGITNQRESTILWDKETGLPLHPAIVWKDTRCQNLVNQLEKSLPSSTIAKIQKLSGLRLSTYFSALKVRWLLENDSKVKEACDNSRCMFGTVDSWLLYKLGNKEHVTDITNASRTLLCNIHTGAWDPFLLESLGIPSSLILPTIKSSSEHFVTLSHGPYSSIPITGCLGDQQAALLGNFCTKPGDAKNTYGTGCFLLYNTGTTAYPSESGLLTTVAYQLGPNAPLTYALEGSISAAGSSITWLKDNMKIVSSPKEVSDEAATVRDAHGIYFVPAFNGLFAPRWRSDARGVLVGLSGSETKAHLCRAVLEAVCYQTKEILDVMKGEAHTEDIHTLKVDGGMTKSDVLLQIQSDILGVAIERNAYPESTALGAAVAAGLHLSIFDLKELERHPLPSTTFKPSICEEERDEKFSGWNKAVERSLHWI